MMGLARKSTHCGDLSHRTPLKIRAGENQRSLPGPVLSPRPPGRENGDQGAAEYAGCLAALLY
jgi:hypothetical protein